MKINQYAGAAVIVAGFAMTSSAIPAQAASEDNLICGEIEDGNEDSIVCVGEIELSLTCGYPSGDDPYIETGMPICDDNNPSGAPRGGKTKISARKKATISARLKKLNLPRTGVGSKLPAAGLLTRDPAMPSPGGPASIGAPTSGGTARRIR